MHRVIVPVDFSETSLNASRYTAQMLSGKEDALAILYTNYDSHDDHDVVLNYQESLKKEFLKAGVKAVQTECEIGGDLIENISKQAQRLQATLIVMGITGKSAIRAAMFGSNTLKLIDRNSYPVMIIPPDAAYKGMNNIAFASDFKNVKETTPAALLDSVLEIFNPRLHIFHVNKETNVSDSPEIINQRTVFEQLFSKYDIHFHFLVKRDFYAAVDTFIKDQNIDVMITIPKHKSNSMSLFKSTHTKRLAYHSHIPILAAHE